MTRPQPSESAPYYYRYTDLITTDDIVPTLRAQLEDTLGFLSSISEEKSLHSYAPGKWTIREVQNHVNDTERVFLYRAFWFARGFDAPLPGYDQDVCVASASANNVAWASLVEEFKNVRSASLSFFESLPENAWSRSGIASDFPFTVNALAYILAGHLVHHTNVLKERYLTAKPILG